MMPGLLKLNPDVVELPKPALRLPDGLLVVPNPNDDAPVALLPKAELLPNPSRIIVKTYNKKKLQTQQLKTHRF